MKWGGGRRGRGEGEGGGRGRGKVGRVEERRLKIMSLQQNLLKMCDERK